MTAKEQLIELFNQNVKGKTPDVSSANIGHDGKYGHWLERQFGISANADNKADILGFELKNETHSKTSFGDWSANEYIFNKPEYKHIFRGSTSVKRRDCFLRMFGKPNPEKGGRCSWSGRPAPTIKGYNEFGQVLFIDDKEDILALYSFSKDMRPEKSTIIPAELQQENVVLARWYGRTSPTTKRSDKCLKAKVEEKFNDQGWFTCKTDSNGAYDRICFGKPVNYDSWLDLVKKGIVYFDSGMYEVNPRPYSMWRANNQFWDSLIYEEYK